MTKTIKTDHLTVSTVLDEQDAKMLYQSYRLNELPNGWSIKEGLSPTEFIDVADEIISANYDLNLSIRRESQPLCIVFGKDLSRFILMGDTVWWPKTGDKSKLQSAAAAFNSIRKDRVGIFEAEYKHKKFYESLVNRKILRRVGSFYDTIEKGSRTTFFQTRMM